MIGAHFRLESHVLRLAEIEIAVSPFHFYLYGRNRGPLPTSFAESEARLVKLARLYFEPDGSFAWTSGSDGDHVFGMIYDDAEGRVQYCELRGTCGRSALRELLDAIVGEDDTTNLELLVLPEQRLEELQTFEEKWWPPIDPS